MNKITIFLATLGVVFTPLLVVVPTGAQGAFDKSKEQACLGAALGTNNPCDGTATTKADSLIQTIVNLLTAIVGIVAVIVIIINGLRFITSGGDSNGVASARNGIIYALVGLIIVVLAQVIVRFVLNRTG